MADPRIKMLRRVPLFAACDDKQLTFIVTQVDEVDFPAGRVLCREGDSGGEFFVLVDGSARVERKGNVLRDLGPGDFFGEIALVDHGLRTATVTVLTPSRCLVLGPGQFQNVVRQDASIGVAVLQALGARLRAVLDEHPV